MDFVLKVTVEKNPRAEVHGKIVEVETESGDIREVLFHLEEDSTRNALVDADTVATDILDLFQEWGSSSRFLWTVTAVEEA